MVLFKKGKFLMMGHGLVTGSLSSHLRVQTRVKILTEAGKSNGEIAIGHSDWLAGQFRDFQVSDVKAVEEPDERRVTVTWSLAQREEEVLGDETSLVPSAPLGPRAQPFVQPAAVRKTMVMFDYASRDEVELRLRWPASWKVESLPRPVSLKNGAGALTANVVMTEGESSLTYHRQLDVTRRTLDRQQEYEMAQSLFGEAEKSDAQALLLVRR